MKTYRLVALLVCFSSFFSCDENLVNYSEEVVPNNNEYCDDGYTYPKSDNFISTRGDSFETDWENTNSITTATGTPVNTPWANQVTDANLPLEIAYDIKKEDGWEMIFHTFGTSMENAHKNYIIFHNIRTGIVKIFYYLERAAFVTNNTGLWKFTFNNENKYFSFTDELAFPVSLRPEVKYYTLSTISNHSEKGFAVGWNCVILSLAYNPDDDSSYLDIFPYNVNTAFSELFLSYRSFANGTIISHGSKNDVAALSNDLVTVVGKSSGKWIQQQYDKIPGTEEPATRSIIGDLLNGAASAVVKFGLNKALSSFIGGFSQPTTTKHDVQLTTTGTGTIQGGTTFPTPASFPSIRINTSLVGKLGVWNLSTPPVIRVNGMASISPNNPYSGGGMCAYQNIGLKGIDISPVINPELLNSPYYVSHRFEVEAIRYRKDSHAPTIKHKGFDYGNASTTEYSMGEYFQEKNLIFGKFDAPYDSLAIFKNEFKGEFDVFIDGEVPEPMISIPSADVYGAKGFDRKTTFVKVTMYLYTNINGKTETTVSTRTFVPKIIWG